MNDISQSDAIPQYGLRLLVPKMRLIVIGFVIDKNS